MHIRSITFFFLLIFSLSGNAHSPSKDKSYIVTKTNDTIYGKIKVNILIGGLKLITADTSYVINPNIYLAYYNAKKKAVYRSKVLPGFIPEKLAKKLSLAEKADWLKCIEDGEIKLYEYKHSNLGNNADNVLDVACTISSVIATSGAIPNIEFTNWYVEKEGTQLTPIIYSSFTVAGSKPRKERKELLRSLLADNGKVSQNYSQTKPFTFKTVQTLIQEYNISKT
ncbi:hypothetical protein OIU83_09325 [Flavobacterium sp. LS1R49]|uniref:GLPGLI family protein n=1 Tax=Flavobacterium shii TaxID=2987687 RepID=A0A9X3C5R7_9FLAO|nr:hypothetical protein [Flavobacterium shii]MCV9927852.1 hypothetical protein [Flavobacterium shii]